MFFDRKTSPDSVQDLANLKITDARLGDTLSVAGAAPDFSDVDLTIDRCDSYQAGERRWIELSGPWRETRASLQVHRSGPVDVLGNFDGRILTLDELGLSEDDLAEIDQRQNPADFFDYAQKFWLYRFSRETAVFASGAAASRGFYCWHFQEQDSRRFLTIRKFAGEPFAASLWTGIEPADITVYRGN